MDAGGQLRQQSLSRGDQSASKQTPLPAVGVAGKDQSAAGQEPAGAECSIKRNSGGGCFCLAPEM